MSFHLGETLDLLRRTPTVLDVLLRGIAPDWHAIDEGPATWSAREVLGHLVHGEETDWVPRARLVLDHGEDRPFEPFDRLAQRRRFTECPLERLLDRFAELRRDNLEVVGGWKLNEERLDRRGRHPELGPVTLRQLIATWASHDLGHLAQVGRVMAKRHTEEVGPWRQYLGILGR